MTNPGEPPPPPPPAPSSSVTGRRLKRPYVCGVIALLASAGLIASVFWAWLVPVLASADEMTGWEIYQAAGDTGENSFLIADAFRDGFSPLFTGLSVAIAGGVLAALALVLMVSPKAQQPSKWGVPAGLGSLIALVGLAVLFIPLVNLSSLIMTQPRPYLIQPGGGLTGGFLLAAVGGIALAIGATGSPGRKERASGR